MSGSRVDISERIELADAIVAEFAGRLLAVATPSAVLDHAQRIELRGLELLAQAEKIRSSLAEDTENRAELLARLRRAECESELLRLYRARGERAPVGVAWDALVRHVMKRG